MIHARADRRGAIYVMLMATVAIVVALALTGAALVRVQRKAAELTIDTTEARAGARVAVEYAAAVIDSNSNWRADLTAAGGSNTLRYGRGEITYAVTDPVDGNLTNSVSDPVAVVGTGTVGAAAQQYSAKFTPKFLPMGCLDSAVAIDGNTGLTNSVVSGTGRIASNRNITGTSARVWLNAEAGGAVSGAAFYGTTTSGAPARQMPDATVFSAYSSIAATASRADLDRMVLSPQKNPTSATLNTQGVYVMDCGGNDVRIRRSRLYGTLVLLNVGTLLIDKEISWEPAVPGYPALLVQGNVQFSTPMTPLSEANEGTNFNPAGAPFKGVTNATKADVYPCEIKGLVYCSGDMTVSGELQIDGVLVVGGRLTVTSSLSVRYDDTYYYTPPPGFRASTVMMLVPGTFAQVVH